MTIITVENKKQLREFVYFPKTHYQSDPFWVPPIWFDEKTAYGKKKNPILANSDFLICLASRDNRIVGRNLVYLDWMPCYIFIWARPCLPGISGWRPITFLRIISRSEMPWKN
jgi:hypothetical protein